MGLGRSVQGLGFFGLDFRVWGFGFTKFTRNQIGETLKLPGLAKKNLEKSRISKKSKSPKFKTLKTDEI